MQLFRKQPVATVLLSTLLTTGLLSSTAFAQKTAAASTNNAAATTELPNLTSAAAAATKSTDAATSNAATTKDANTDNTSAKVSTTPTPTTESAVVITGNTSGTNTVIVEITGTATETGGGLTGLPKLSGSYTIPTAQVPPTANAPYMQESKLPAGTVFITVGAILGFLALSVLLWRVLTVWALKRSVKRAAMANNMQDSKALLNFHTPAPPLYKYSDRDSVMSLSNLKKNPKSPGRPSTANGGLGNTPGQSLFFSPTAGAARGSSLLNPGDRSSSYLPSGYYAAGSAAPGNGTGMAHIGGPGLSAREAISLSNLGPAAQGYSRTRSMGTTPPDSPNVASALGVGHSGNLSTSTLGLDLNQRPRDRAPSAYLDDLFDEAGAAPGNYPIGHPAYQGNRM